MKTSFLTRIVSTRFEFETRDCVMISHETELIQITGEVPMQQCGIKICRTFNREIYYIELL